MKAMKRVMVLGLSAALVAGNVASSDAAPVLTSTAQVKSVAGSTITQAHWGWGWGWGVGAFLGGLALGAALAAPPYYYGYPYGYYGYPYGYYGYPYAYAPYPYWGYPRGYYHVHRAYWGHAAARRAYRSGHVHHHR